MQTIYYSTSNFIRHTGNVVDLNEYRRRQALAQEGSLAPQPEAEYVPDREEWERPALRVVQLPQARQRRRRLSRPLLWDLCASLSVVVMTLTFTVRVLMV